MKIALAQINPTIGDFAGNRTTIAAVLKQARERGAELCVFPELGVCGYPPHDLLERDRFCVQNVELLHEIAELARGIAVIVGYVRQSTYSRGKRLENAAALLVDGRIASSHSKTLLPTYDVFDERRYFAPADRVQPAELNGVRIGITICEDIWNLPGFPSGPLYHRDPVAELVEQKAELIINIAASPFTLEKRQVRPQLLSATARRHGRPLVFVNQVGGNDDLVFDGSSLALSAEGKVLARGAEFAEDLVCVDLATDRGDIREPCPSDESAVVEALVLGLGDYARKCGFDSVVLGLSGGIDSAVVAALATRALGPENVTAVAMPSRFSAPQSLSDAQRLAHLLGIDFQVLGIDDLFQVFLDQLGPVFAGLAPDVTEENIQARIRGVLLMALSNKHGHLLLSTGNKSELATGYATLYGDMAGGLAVLSDVPKTLVYLLAAELNRQGTVIPQEIIDKPPSAELAPNQLDEDSLPPYPLLDRIIELYVDQGLDEAEILALGLDGETVARVTQMIRVNEYKRRQAPPGIKITAKAFGPGRRIPIAHRWKG